jgi:uncharacterized membrane protein YbhN (UPF0104 family)
MLRRPAMSRWIRLGLLAFALAFCAYGLVSQRAEATAALHQLSWGSVAGAMFAAIVGLGCQMLSWRTVVRDLGSPVSVRSATRITFIAQLGKYLPGAVWATAAQVELAREHDVPRKRGATAAVVSMLITLATGLLAAAVALPLSSGNAARHYWWALALALPALIGLYPPLTGQVLDRLLRLARRPPLERRISGAGMARAIAWSLLGWGFFGLQAWLLVADVTGKGANVLPVAVGAYALAWSVGFILIPFPGGLGPRELAFIAALAPVMPRGSAIVVAVVSRLVMTTADLIWAATAFALGRVDRRRHRGSRPVPAHSQAPPEPGTPGRDVAAHPGAATENSIIG